MRFDWKRIFLGSPGTHGCQGHIGEATDRRNQDALQEQQSHSFGR